jgi:hypothetical protein
LGIFDDHVIAGAGARLQRPAECEIDGPAVTRETPALPGERPVDADADAGRRQQRGGCLKGAPFGGRANDGYTVPRVEKSR